MMMLYYIEHKNMTMLKERIYFFYNNEANYLFGGNVSSRSAIDPGQRRNFCLHVLLNKVIIKFHRLLYNLIPIFHCILSIVILTASKTFKWREFNYNLLITRWSNSGSMLGQRRKRWPSIEPALVHRFFCQGRLHSAVWATLSLHSRIFSSAHPGVLAHK